MNYFDLGDVIRLRAVFTNSQGSAVDPSTVTFQHRFRAFDPLSYSTLVYGVNSIVKTGAGNYYHDFFTSQQSYSGELRYRWNGLGDNAAAVEGALMVSIRHVG